jgi:hypothetical protein
MTVLAERAVPAAPPADPADACEARDLERGTECS